MQVNYGTVSETINQLRKEGYDHDFNINDECLICHKAQAELSPDEFEIDAVYRFEGDSNPDDEAIVYAISSTRYNIKGVLVNAYGIYAEGSANGLVQKLNKHL